MTDRKTYVWEGTEVVLTGRKSIKKGKTRVFELHEITPNDPELGSFKKWVRMIDLYEIVE